MRGLGVWRSSMGALGPMVAAVILLLLWVPGCGDDPQDAAQDATGDPSGDADITEPDLGDLGDLGSDADPPDAVDDPLALCRAGEATTLTEAEGAALAFPLSANRRVAVTVPPGAVEVERELGLSCPGGDILPAGQGLIALSEPVVVDFWGELEAYATVEIPIDASLLPEGARPSAVHLYFQPRAAERVVSPPGVDLQENLSIGFVSFSTRHGGVYQVAVSPDVGQAFEREWQFRAITGVSMGASGASMIGLRHHDRFDLIGALGGPVDWTYIAHYIREGGLGGFGPAPDFGSVPGFEPTEQFEHNMTFDDFYYATGEGTGGTFDRREYLNILQDMSLSFGNMAGYSDISPFLPPGVPLSELERPFEERCPGEPGSVLTIESGFYDREYNPEGSLPVIMFCDGTPNTLLGCDVAPAGQPCDPDIVFDRYCYLNDPNVPDQPNRGWYPGPDVQQRPVSIAWAVDLNENSRRDRGEPVIRQFYEPFEDVGADGLASPDEPGYHPIDNPDPSGDDYHWFHNPSGTEGNWLYDEGEPYEDVGLDGVPGTPQLHEGGYDYGEGNDQFDYNPNLARLLFERDPHHAVWNLTAEDWDQLDIYLDAGIRDLFNFAVATNQLAGQIQATGQNLRIYNGFHSLGNLDPALDNYRFHEVNYAEVGDHVFLRYGDPGADEERVCVGDGKHVGPPGQIANRLLTMLGFIESRFPDGEYTVIEPPYPTPLGTYEFWSPRLGGFQRYSIILPPGHELTQCSDRRDNAGDGLIDGDDPDCLHGMHNREGPGPSLPLCSDGIDNDLDGLIDMADPDCLDPDQDSEYPADHPLREARFPVVYLLHGYGQGPDDLLAAVAPFAGFMGGGIWQKVIVVYPDGFCGEYTIPRCPDGSRPDEGDCVDGEVTVEEACVKGTFYTDHPAWPSGLPNGPAFEDAMLDLVEHVDAVYRTRPPEVFSERR